MAKKFLASLHGGMNRHDEPEMLGENVVQQSIGIDFSDAGKLRPFPGGRDLNIDANHIGSGWVNGAYAIYYSNDTGLYRWQNNTRVLLSTAITGTFDVEVMNDVAYIASTKARLRDDGTTVSTWGITEPASAPTLSAVAHSTKVINACDATTGWTISGGTLTTNTACVEGTKSLRILTDTGARAIATWTGSLDLARFSSTQESTNQDYIEIHAYFTDISQLTNIAIVFDINDGSFTKDGFYYLLPMDSSTFNVLAPNPAYLNYVNPTGQPAPNPTDTINTLLPTDIMGTSATPASGGDYDPFTYYASGVMYDSNGYPVSYTPQLTLPSSTQMRPIVIDNTKWVKFRIHKHEFVRFGATAGKDWSTFAGMAIYVQPGNDSVADILIDWIHLRGGGKHKGTYAAIIAYAVGDSDGNTIRVSGCSPVSSFVETDQQKITVSLPVSTDSQVNQRKVFLRGGLMGNWYCAATVNNNTATSTTINIADWEYQDIITNYYPVEGGRKVVDTNVPKAFNLLGQLGNRIVGGGVGGSNNYLWFSSRNKADDMPAFHGIYLTHKGEQIKNILPGNDYIHVRGDIQEYRVFFNDPADIATVSYREIDGAMAGVGQNDAAKILGGQIVGVTQDNIIMSDGYASKPIHPAIIDIIGDGDSGFAHAKSSVACVRERIFVSAPFIDGNYTLLLDAYQGFRPVYAWDRAFGAMQVNKKTGSIYGLYNNSIWKLNSQYGWGESGAKFYIKSAKYGFAPFFDVELIKLTYIGDFTLSLYMDDNLITTHAVSSATKKTEDFGAGLACSGRFFHFVIDGESTESTSPIIYMPIAITWAPGEGYGG